MELILSLFALLIAITAIAMSVFAFWLDWRKAFKLQCTIRGVILYPPLEGLSDTPLSLILPLVLRNEGARPGVIQAAYVRLLTLENPQREYRLEALVTVDTNLVLQMASAEDQAEKAKALLGIGAFIQIGKYELKEIGIHFAWPPVDAKRYYMFAQPVTLTPEDYKLELWCCIQNRWGCYAQDPVVKVRSEMLHATKSGKPSINLSGGIYDTAPSAPLGGGCGSQ